MKLILLGAIIFALFIVLDLLWFSVAGNFFKNQIGSIARLNADGTWNVLLWAGALAYVLMSVGVLYFVLPQAHSVVHAALLGGLFGLVGYGLYDLTNLATLTAWTPQFAMVDMLWGTFLCGVVSAVAYTIRLVSFFV